MDTSATHRVRARLISGSIERTEAEQVPYSVDIAAAPNPDIDTPERGPVLQLRVTQWPDNPEREREILKSFVPHAEALRRAILAAQQGRASDFLYPEDAPNWGVRVEGEEGEVRIRRLDPSSRLPADDAFALDNAAIPELQERLQAARFELKEAQREFFSEGSPEAGDGEPVSDDFLKDDR
ncbi:hypothetical protein [Deinococcus sp.]|uniref:hypothetical protein n=1 Tax=Deinococcus sp. TaxID=47478 RepID=UPI003B5A7E3E